jgi:HEAT repeats
MACRSLAVGLLALAILTLTELATRAAEPQPKSATQWLDAFGQAWDETKWEKTFRTAPNGIMRPLEDAGWKVRMQALHGMVVRGKEAIPTLLEALKSKDTPRRVFAAQVLGFLAPDVPHESLLEAAKNDPDAAVRLHAVDSLGMQGTKEVDLPALEKAEQSGDVRKHIGYARERAGQPLDPAVVQQLRNWNPSTIDAAAVGKAAPDFALKSATGETIRLTDFRGKSAVVLVFIYGDT